VGEARRRRINEAANPLTHATPIGPYVDKAALTKAGFVEAGRFYQGRFGRAPGILTAFQRDRFRLFRLQFGGSESAGDFVGLSGGGVSAQEQQPLHVVDEVR